ncbi:MAG: hypothetical protein EOM23_11815, partial [Candidatus Moranbacteria bacterium]|nr:hypothetical protein [Candidatus Moranbacteria bacterium]
VSHWHRSYAITSHNRVFAWGWNANGELGDGTTTMQLGPIEITSSFNLSNLYNIIKIIPGLNHNYALKELYDFPPLQ